MLLLLFHMLITPFLAIAAIMAVLAMQLFTVARDKIKSYSWKQSEE